MMWSDKNSIFSVPRHSGFLREPKRLRDDSKWPMTKKEQSPQALGNAILTCSTRKNYKLFVSSWTKWVVVFHKSGFAIAIRQDHNEKT